MTKCKDKFKNSSTIYKLLKKQDININDKPVVIFETICMTTSYNKAKELLDSNPMYSLETHKLNYEKRPYRRSYRRASYK